MTGCSHTIESLGKLAVNTQRNATQHNRMGNNRNMCGWAIESLTTILPRHPCYFSMAILLNKNEIRFIQQKANEAK